MASDRPAIAVPQDDVIVRVSGYRRPEGDGLDLLEASAKQLDRLIGLSGGELVSADQVSSDFIRDGGRRHHFVLTNTVLEQLGADSPRDECGDEDVRVEDEPHETRSKTSSSVKIPCA
jgi:hypothetical protein